MNSSKKLIGMKIDDETKDENKDKGTDKDVLSQDKWYVPLDQEINDYESILQLIRSKKGLDEKLISINQDKNSKFIEIRNKPNLKIINDNGVSINDIDISLSLNSLNKSMEHSYLNEENQSVLNQADLDSIFSIKNIESNSDKEYQERWLANEIAKEFTTKQVQILHQLNKKEEKYQRYEKKYKERYEEIQKVKKNLNIENNWLGRKANKDTYNNTYLKTVSKDQIEIQKLLKYRDYVKKFGTTSIIQSPNFQIEFRIGDQIIPLNSSFLYSKQTDRLKTSMVTDLSHYYDCTSFNYQDNDNCYDLQLKEKNTGSSFIQKVEDIAKAQSYYQSQNHSDAKELANLLEARLLVMTSPVPTTVLTQEKTFTKKLSNETMKWIKSQKWNSRKYMIGPEKNVENLVGCQLSERAIKGFDLFNGNKLTKENTIKRIQKFYNTMKTKSFIDFQIGRYQPSQQKSIDFIEKLKLDQPDKIFSNCLYSEILDKKIEAWIWIERYTEHNQSFIVKYNVILTEKDITYF